MNRKMSIYDFTKPAELTAIATYAYLRYKQAKGYVLTDNESDLLNGNIHTSQLSMILNSNRYYPYTDTEYGFITELSLENYIRLSTAGIMTEIGDDIEFDMEYLLSEMTSKIPDSSMLPQYVPVILGNAESLFDDTMLIFTKINTMFGAVVKCYKYSGMTYDELMYEVPYIGDGIKFVLATSKTKPDWDSIVYSNGLWDDLMYTYCRGILGIDFELVYRGNEKNLPVNLLNRIKCDIYEILPIFKEKYYDVM